MASSGLPGRHFELPDIARLRNVGCSSARIYTSEKMREHFRALHRSAYSGEETAALQNAMHSLA